MGLITRKTKLVLKWVGTFCPPRDLLEEGWGVRGLDIEHYERWNNEILLSFLVGKYVVVL